MTDLDGMSLTIDVAEVCNENEKDSYLRRGYKLEETFWKVNYKLLNGRVRRIRKRFYRLRKTRILRRMRPKQ